MNTKHMFVAALAVSLFSLAACGSKDTLKSGDAQAVDSTITAEKTFVVNSESTTLAWKGSKISGSSHNGTITVSEGSLNTAGGNLVGGKFVVDMNSIVCLDLEDADKNGRLIGHLKSDDFFSVEQFPTADFEITNAEKLAAADNAGNNYNITGNLTIKGITRSITFPANIQISDNATNAKAEFTIDRSEWDVRYGSGKFFDNLGDNMINDAIEFTLDLNASAN